MDQDVLRRRLRKSRAVRLRRQPGQGAGDENLILLSSLAGAMPADVLDPHSVRALSSSSRRKIGPTKPGADLG